MGYRLRPGHRLTPTSIQTLRSVRESAEQRLPDIGTVHEYTLWANNAREHMQTVLSDEAVHQLLVTPRALAIPTMDPPAVAIININAERRDFAQHLASIIDSLQEAFARWQPDRSATIVIPDTNIFLHHEHEIERIPWRDEVAEARQFSPFRDVRIVLPILVVDELDGHKRDETRARARRALRTLQELLPNASGRATLDAGDGSDGVVTIEVLVDPLDHVRLTDNDSEIVDRAIAIASLAGEYQRVVVITGDTGMAFRAAAHGVRHVKVTFPETVQKRHPRPSSSEIDVATPTMNPG